jgi:hypothetical protein
MIIYKVLVQYQVSINLDEIFARSCSKGPIPDPGKLIAVILLPYMNNPDRLFSAANLPVQEFPFLTHHLQ